MVFSPGIYFKMAKANPPIYFGNAHTELSTCTLIEEKTEVKKMKKENEKRK